MPTAVPCGRYDYRPGGGRRTLFAGVVISPFDGRGPRGARDCLPGGGRCTLFAGGVFRPSVGQLAARHTRLVAGRGPTHPIAGAVYALHGGQRAAADSESGARAGARSHCHTRYGGQRAAADSESGARDGAPISLSHSARRPAGRSGLRVGHPGRGLDLTVSRRTGPVASRGHHDLVRARGRTATQTLSRTGPFASQWAVCARPCAAGAVSLDGGGRQSGRCGALTRIRVGAAAAAGPDRYPGPPALRAATSPDKV